MDVQVAESFLNFIEDWDYETYLCVGGYGSGKSWHIAFKIILKLLQEKRKALVVREVYETISESCFDLICEILKMLNLYTDEKRQFKKGNKVLALKSPLQLNFPNGSKIIFRGMDKPQKVKSMNGVSIVWLEEASEIKFAAYEELQGRIRTNDVSMHFFLSLNPVGKENWTYSHFFRNMDEDGREHVILDEEKLYKKKTIIKNGVYYHHSLPDDNPFLPENYIRRLDNMKTYDPYLWKVARQGRFGTTGLRVLPQFEIASNAKEFKKAVKSISETMNFVGMDFGFEESFNAVIKCAVDDKNKVLYIYDEIYINHVTDDKMASLPEMQAIKDSDKWITADAAEPKTIQYYRQRGFKMKPCKKFAGSRLANTRKIKRFHKIICSPKCKNTIRELNDLTYKKDSKGNAIYDEFNIDPHTFSAIWYALDNYTVADIKEKSFNSKRGN